MKILITGGDGILATSLKKILSKKYIIITKNRTEMDITNIDQVDTIFSEVKPDIVIHTAANTNVEECEVKPDLAELINVQGTKNIVDIAKKNSCKVIFISSTGIYGTEKETEFYETDKVEPTTVHHKTKWIGENYCLDNLSNTLIIRTGWIFGGEKNHKKNFVWNRIREARNSDSIFGDPNQKGNPTYAIDLAFQIQLMIEKNLSGIFNVCGIGSATRLEYVRAIVQEYHLKTEVREAPEGYFKRKANVSSNESAENKKLNELEINIMKPWKDSLKTYIQILKNEVEEWQ